MNNNRRSGFKIMSQLIGLVFPLAPVMLVAIALGVVGYLCAIFIPIFGARVLVNPSNSKTIFIIMIAIAILRGIFHYIEQYCNHFIAFKLLALIRHKVFASLRALCPAKLEGRDKGNLISIITTDIELLEVFYAHTISPIAIGFLTSLIMVIFIGQYNWVLAVIPIAGYIVVGGILPVINGKRTKNDGMEFRNDFGRLNAFLLDSLRGVDETIQYNCGKEREDELIKKSKKLSGLQRHLSNKEGSLRALTDICIMFFGTIMLFSSAYLYSIGNISLEGVFVTTVAMLSSFGPVIALSNLSNNLNQTLASGERVLSILEEKPMVNEIFPEDNKDFHEYVPFKGVNVKDVSFAYGEEQILEKLSLEIEPEKITGILGKSGCGKSTLLKLIMRFWSVNKGEIDVNECNVEKIPTTNLRDMVSYVTQETYLFHDTIKNNILIGNESATMEQIEKACKKASIYDWIMSLPKGFDTEVGELGEALSGGERQRIGLARAFVHDSSLLLLDEPTSNVDSLNEGIILKALKEECKDKTVVLVTHRKSTLGVADKVFKMSEKRKS